MQTDEVTSALLPTDAFDFNLGLEISDRLRNRSAPVPATLQKISSKLFDPNPNVQLLALLLLDTCIKNAGETFVKSVAQPEFLDDFVGALIKKHDAHHQVRERALDLLQTWTLASSDNLQYDYFGVIYDNLKRNRVSSHSTIAN